LREEIDILQRLATWARAIGIDTKTHALLRALDIGFEQMAITGAGRKALIFTESSRTQAPDYSLRTSNQAVTSSLIGCETSHGSPVVRKYSIRSANSLKTVEVGLDKA
jgi:hypothetical protein